MSNYLYGAIYIDSPQILGAPENNYNTERDKWISSFKYK